jgi:hypothetical protein
MITPGYLRERAAHYRQLANEAEALATTLRKVADGFLAEAELEAAAQATASQDQKDC